jgi:hypothetical protein
MFLKLSKIEISEKLSLPGFFYAIDATLSGAPFV